MTTAFNLNDTQLMLCDSLTRYLSEQYSLEQRRLCLAAADREPPLWRAFAQQLGLLGAGFSEAEGGLGGGMTEHLVIMETLGSHLAGEPYLSSVVLAGGLLQRAGGANAQRLITRLIEGEALLAVAHTEPGARHELHDVRTALSPSGNDWVLNGRKAMVHGAPWATDLIVVARSSGTPQDTAGLTLLVLPVNTPGIRRRDYQTVDGGRASEIEFAEVRVEAAQLLGTPGHALALLQQARDDATLAVCAEACGILARLMADTVAYAKERKQFGVAIASFQALQHRMADMHIALEQLQAITVWAAESLSGDEAERTRAISSAKVCAGRACRVVGQGAVQIHGGMGMTDELAIGHYFRRATQIEQLFGSSSHHLRRVAALMEQ